MGEGECKDEVRSIAGERDMKFGNFVSEKVSEAVSERRAWGRGR